MKPYILDLESSDEHITGLSEPREALVDFITACLAVEEEADGRPQKRRRVGYGLYEDLVIQEASLPDHITLCRARIALVEPSGRPDHDASHSNHTTSLKAPVMILKVTPGRDAHRHRVNIALADGSGRKAHTITFSASTESDHEGLFEVLQNAAEMGPYRALRKGQLPTASWSEAFLVREHDSFRLDVSIHWKTGPVIISRKELETKETALSQYLSVGRPPQSNAWSPQDFYESVHVPEKNAQTSDAMHIPRLTSDLYPFQRRAVHWLLNREGVQIGENGSIEPVYREGDDVPLSFHRTSDYDGQVCYVSHLHQMVLKPEQLHQERLPDLHGGVLSEEMGLGKTVEITALLCLHTAPSNVPATSYDSYTKTEVLNSGSTLIISPPSILEQWKNELEVHAPTLKVFHYTGVKGSNDAGDEGMRETLLNQDVVLTTYGVLAREIHYAHDKPKRDLRHGKRYAVRRSPLVQIYWWRVCLDEAQMVESGVSNAATVARMIPRRNAWAVSGTPLRKDVNDLLGLLIFLRYEPFCRPDVWQRTIGAFKDIFSELFGQIALRHTKSAIRDEIHIPPQKRVVLTVPFTAIEEQHYSHLFQQMCDDCGLDNEGGPLLEDWDPDDTRTVEKMRTWLARLRQTCLHVEVGVRNRRALGDHKGPLRTVDEVLEVMIDQNETALRSTERAALLSKVMQGHLYFFGKDTQHALDVYLASLNRATEVVKECRVQLEQERTKVQKELGESSDLKLEVEDDEDGEEDEPNEVQRRLRLYRQRLRSALEVQHICSFFAGTAYFNLKEQEAKSVESTEQHDDKVDSQTELDEVPPSERFQELEREETQLYEQAKGIRKELLLDVTNKALRTMEKIKPSRSDSLVQVPRIEPFENTRGIESRKLVEQIELITKYLNDQAKQLHEWRLKLADLLSRKLLDQDDEPELTGEEYEASTKQQDEQFVYFELYRAAVADRQRMITGQANLLIDHEMKENKKLATNGQPENPEEKGHAPELMLELLDKRDKVIIPEKKDLSLRGCLAEVRHVLTSVQWQEGQHGNSRAAVEAHILQRELENLQKVASTQTKCATALERELDVFRTTMNQRLEFYKQLQQLSDAVAPLQEEASDQVDQTKLASAQKLEQKDEQKLANLKTKRRFLAHLRDESSGKQEPKICVICQSPFEIGVLTVCGHQYCKECIRLWWSEHRNCPMCKKHLRLSDFHEITYKPRELRGQEERQSSSPEETSPTAHAASKSSIYTDISNTTLDEIKSVDLQGSFGTKIDTLARHLIWLRDNDPGAKSVIFSQYRDFLNVLGSAFNHFKIGFSEIGTKNGIAMFRENPSVECFLLHAKADSSGLNLVNATHVFLCEPLINAAIELQAIARVHRIGQRRATTVWMYLVSDTVEEAIYDISVSRRLAHMQKAGGSRASASASASRAHSRAATPAVEESKLDAANTLELQGAPISRLLTKGHSGGEMVAHDDLWNCLFSKPRRGGKEALGSGADAGARLVGTFLRAEAAEGRRNES